MTFRCGMFFLLSVTSAMRAADLKRTVAITFDDLPYAAAADQQDVTPASAVEADSVNRKILAALRRHCVPATGFVIESRIEHLGRQKGRGILEDWIKDGFDLGNHTFSHRGANQMSVEEFEADVISGERTFVPLMRRAQRGPGYFFRFPMNQTGDAMEKHDHIADFLFSRGYRLAPCTIENEDYVFNRAYGRMAESHDDSKAEELRKAYLRYTSEEIDYYAALHRKVLGYEPPQIMLLHDNRLNADTVDLVLQLFIEKGFEFISLTDAEADGAYQIPDTFLTRFGPMWGYRWAQERNVKVNGSLESEPPAWISDYPKLPTQPSVHVSRTANRH